MFVNGHLDKCKYSFLIQMKVYVNLLIWIISFNWNADAVSMLGECWCRAPLGTPHQFHTLPGNKTKNALKLQHKNRQNVSNCGSMQFSLLFQIFLKEEMINR